jgi:DNA invertase Pin-like site-specific DNA recombinase
MSTSNGKPLRFAALPRVSTVRQEQQGESLRTQRADIERDVARLGGSIVVWYGGQEHGTPGWEKQQLGRLLRDATKGKFDALMVTHTDRWSRDNAQNKEGLEVFRSHGIRFFVGTMEMNLFDPQHCFILGMSAEVGEFIASQQSKKSIENKIARARRGVPSNGRLPFGRTFDKDTEQWGIDPAKQHVIAEIARRYVAGERLLKLADEFGFAHSPLIRLLKNRCGSEWTVEFNSPRLNIREKVTVRIPPLLDDATIKAVRERLIANRTYLHRTTPKKHLLAGHIFCAACGYAMFVQAHRSTLRYYRHAHTRRCRHCPLRPKPCIRADAIEEAVLSELFQLCGNPAMIERAVKAAIPDCDALLEKQQRLGADLDKVSKSRERLLSLIVKGTITDAQAEKQLGALKQREDVLKAEFDAVKSTLAEVPDADTLRVYVQQDGNSIFLLGDDGEMYAGGNTLGTWLMFMDDDHAQDRRDLIKGAFGRCLPDGKPAGVYLTPAGGARHGPKTFTYELRGRLPAIPGLPGIPNGGLPKDMARRVVTPRLHHGRRSGACRGRRSGR